MKKYLFGFVGILLLFVPMIVKADSVSTMGLVDTLSAEGITFDSTSYIESTNKINIYMFRGHNCTYCKKFLNYLVSIAPEYGKYFNLVSYEIWSNSANKSVMNDVASYLDQSATGVPFIVIGDQSFIGFAESYESSILSAITDLYNSTNRYDVFTEMANPDNTSSTINVDELKRTYNNTITWLFIVNIATFIGFVVKTNKDKKDILAKIK